MPDFHQRLITIYFVLGILRADDRFDDMWGMNCGNNGLKQEVISTCVALLGFSMQGAQQYVKMYSSDSLKRDASKIH